MTVRELYSILNERISPALSCPWDNDGLMCCPDGNREVKRILITLDVTGRAIDYAATGGFDLIISHHPFIFKGLKALNDSSQIAEGAMRLIRNGISVFSFHTRLDAVEGGVNDTLCALLGLSEVEIFGEEGIGRVGTLAEEMPLVALCDRIKEITGAPFLLAADGGVPCRKVAVLGGEGGDDIELARTAGADTYISGRLGYHNMVDGADGGMNLIEAGHFYTEFPVCFTLEKILKDICPEAESEIFYSNRIMAV